MPPVSHENIRKAANSPRDARPRSAMRLRLALACLTAATSLPACFNPILSCRLTCHSQSDCPAGLTCQPSSVYPGLCAANGDICEPGDGGADIADATTETADATTTDARPEARPAPTQMCTKDGGPCITLSDAVRNGLVLWLDPTNLPPPQQAVPIWQDQSGQGNDAIAQDDAHLPSAFAGGVALVQTCGAGFLVHAAPSLDFGAADFTVLVVASVGNVAATSFFMKVDVSRVPNGQLWLRWVYSDALGADTLQGVVNTTTLTAGQAIPADSPRLYVLRRANDTIELRTNGTSLGSVAITNPSVTTDSAADLYLGVLGLLGEDVGTMEAVVAVRGQIEDSDVSELESYLLAFASP